MVDGYTEAFGYQELQVQMAEMALTPTLIGPPPMPVEWGYAHGTSDTIWPPPNLGGEAAATYVERIVVSLQGLPPQAARGDVLKAAKALTGRVRDHFGILYVNMPQPGSALVYCAEESSAAVLAELFDRDGFPAHVVRSYAGGGASSSRSGGSGSGSGSREKRRGKGTSQAAVKGKSGNTAVTSYHCHFSVSSAFKQHLKDVRDTKGQGGPDSVRAEWEKTHPSGKDKLVKK